MKHLRLWILGAALGSFAAGINVGVAIPDVLANAADGGVPDHLKDDQLYVQDIAVTYGLSAAQQRSLRMVMQAAREEELQALRSAEAAQLPPVIQNRIQTARNKAEQRLRALLTEAQRARYDIDSRPQQNR